MDPVVWPPKQKLSRTMNGIDRINNLPDNIILHILSFLPTRDAIRTSILSRRWKYLWTSMSDIKLDDNRYSSLDFLEFVDRVLRQHDSSDITRLILIVRYKVVPSFRIHSWISTAITHNIQHLNLSMSGSSIPSLPCSLFTCQSLRFLSLDFQFALQTPTSVHLSHLKTLWLHHVGFLDDKSAESLFSGCPVLEELKLWDCEWKNIKNIKIAIPNLKKLEIYHLGVRENRPHVHLSHLKTLWLWHVEFVDDKSAESLFSGCPVLEELKLWDCEWKNIKNIKIAIPNLKKLEIYHLGVRENRPHGVINIYVPNLISLNYHTLWGVNFYLHDLCSLVDASIQSIGPLNDHENARRLLNVVASAYNVKSLAIREPSLKTLDEVNEVADRLPTFHNLTNFTMSSGWAIPCRALMGLLEKMPNLKCINFDGGFVFEGEQHMFERVPTCVGNSLEKVVKSSFTGQRKELYIMRYFLRNANKLEKITLYFDDPSDKKWLAQKLKTLRKGPENCLIELLLKRFVPDTAS